MKNIIWEKVLCPGITLPLIPSHRYGHPPPYTMALGSPSVVFVVRQILVLVSSVYRPTAIKSNITRVTRIIDVDGRTNDPGAGTNRDGGEAGRMGSASR